MKKLLLMVLMFSWAFGFNYNGVWINKSAYQYNDPIKLQIKRERVTPFLYRNSKLVKLKTKKSTNTGVGLYEAWGFGYKNLVLFIKPINKNTIKVYEKKIDTNKKVVISRSFIFKRKNAIIKSIKKRFIGNWSSTDSFSAISKLTVRLLDGKVFVRAWRNTPRGQIPLGIARAKFYNNKLHITWYKGNLVVNATITGLNYNAQTNRYKTLKLYLKAKNLNNNLTNTQTIYFKKNSIDLPRPMYDGIRKHIKLGPVDINLLINSY